MSLLSPAVTTSWQPSANHTAGNFDKEVILIHWWDEPDRRPTFNGTVSWLAMQVSGVSIQYVVEHLRVTQMVREKDMAWHAGHGDANRRSIGIELNPRLSEGDYETAAELIADIWERRGRKLPLEPHRKYTSTNCPGAADLAKLYRMAEAVLARRSPATSTAGGSSSRQTVSRRFLRTTRETPIRHSASSSGPIERRLPKGSFIMSGTEQVEDFIRVGNYGWVDLRHTTATGSPGGRAGLLAGQYPDRPIPDYSGNRTWDDGATQEAKWALIEVLAQAGYEPSSTSDFGRLRQVRTWLEEHHGYDVSADHGNNTWRALQAYLAALGLYAGGIDGDPRRLTGQAIVDWLNSPMVRPVYRRYGAQFTAAHDNKIGVMQ